MRHRLARHARGDEGAGGVLALAVVGVTLLCAVAVLSLGGALGVRQRLIAAADASALAAADTLLGAVSGDPCARADEVARAHRVALASCTLEGAEARVSVTASVLGLSVTARSRAGPPP